MNNTIDDLMAAGTDRLGLDGILRFISYIDATGDCWIWTKCRSREGYGQFRNRGITHLAHRLAYELAHQKRLPSGRQLKWRCQTKGCARPSHLERLYGPNR